MKRKWVPFLVQVNGFHLRNPYFLMTSCYHLRMGMTSKSLLNLLLLGVLFFPVTSSAVVSDCEKKVREAVSKKNMPAASFGGIKLEQPFTEESVTFLGEGIYEVPVAEIDPKSAKSTVVVFQVTTESNGSSNCSVKRSKELRREIGGKVDVGPCKKGSPELVLTPGQTAILQSPLHGTMQITATNPLERIIEWKGCKKTIQLIAREGKRWYGSCGAYNPGGDDATAPCQLVYEEGLAHYHAMEAALVDVGNFEMKHSLGFFDQDGLSAQVEKDKQRISIQLEQILVRGRKVRFPRPSSVGKISIKF